MTLLKKIFNKNYQHLKGTLSESIATMLLRLKGYKIISRNKRVNGVEVDIIALKGVCLHLVEVKYRSNQARTHFAIHPKQQQRLLRQAQQLSSKYQGIKQTQLDVVLFFPQWPFVEHIQNPFGM